jgi:ATP-dependent Clp protease ATP-binding subunit ClpC
MKPVKVIKTFESSSPFMLVMVAVSIAGVIFGLNKVSHWFAPLIFLLSASGLGWLLWEQMQEGRAEKGKKGAVDYAKLGAIDLTRMIPWLKENVRGQDATIEEIVEDLQRNLTLSRPGQLLGAFFLVGPTGTGKTFLAQLIADALYPDSEVVVLRMNQYKQSEDVFTMIGPPPGMPGYEVGGTLTRPVLEKPLRVIVFDELEKAHRDLQHCLYDILDTASCREKSSGKMVDFSGCVFFATCNAAVEELRKIESEHRDPASTLGRRRDALVDAADFDRAFLARWNGIHLMDELSSLHVAEVACLQLARYWRDFGIEVRHASPELILEAVERNEEFKQYGVRQLAGYLRDRTSDAVAQARRSGRKAVELGVGSDGSIQVQPCA